MSDERLLPCPFCGGEAEVITTKTRQGQTSSVRCSKCSCKVTILKPAYYEGDVEKDTVEAWNTRKPMERIVEKLEERQKAFICKKTEPCDYPERLGCCYDRAINDAINIVRQVE